MMKGVSEKLEIFTRGKGWERLAWKEMMT